MAVEARETAVLQDAKIEESKHGYANRNDGPSIVPFNESQYLTGGRLYSIAAGLLVAVSLVQMESSIISTAIVDITDQLGGYGRSSWLFTAYFVTYAGFQMIWAKVSDITGRKPTLILALVVFTVFSGMCGASQNLIQLIMFRWCQGLGGCGVFALVQLIFLELVPPRKWPATMSLITGMIALSTIIGPLLGGGIILKGSWRWIFLLNVPIGTITAASLWFALPARLWNEPIASELSDPTKKRDFFTSIRRVDVIGSTLLVGACILLSTSLQQASLGNSWTSPLVLPLLVLSAPFAIAFLAWQWFITTRRTFPEPVLPWRLCQSRVCVGIIVNTFLAGVVLYVGVAQIPQRFSTVNGLSPLSAAVRLLSFGAFVPAGSAVAGALMGKPKIPPCWMVLFGAVLELIGCIFLSQTSSAYHIEAKQYGFQILVGTGVGFVNAGVILLVPYAVQKQDLAVGSAATSQFRTLGGLVGLAVATTISTPYLRTHLIPVVGPGITATLLQKTETLLELPVDQMNAVRAVFGSSYNLQIKFLIGIAAAKLPATALMWTSQVAESGARKA